MLYVKEGDDRLILVWDDNEVFQAIDSMILPSQFGCSVFPSGRVGAWVYFQRDSQSHSTRTHLWSCLQEP